MGSADEVNIQASELNRTMKVFYVHKSLALLVCDHSCNVCLLISHHAIANAQLETMLFAGHQ